MIRLRASPRGEAPLPPAWSGAIIAICHCHYPHLLPELDARLAHLPEEAELHLTSSVPQVLDGWRRLPSGRRPTSHAHLTENRGRDIRPFFECAARLTLNNDSLVLKLHGKKSDYLVQGDRWRQAMLHGLLPHRGAVEAAVLRFVHDPRLVMLGPRGSFVSHPVYWGENREGVAQFMRRFCGREPNEADLGFFAGTMFWMRGDFLARLLPHIDLAAFEPEPLPRDGSYAHVIERVMAMAAAPLEFGIGEIGRSAPLLPEDVRTRKIRFLDNPPPLGPRLRRLLSRVRRRIGRPWVLSGS